MRGALKPLAITVKMDPLLDPWVEMAEKSLVSNYTMVACLIWIVWDWVCLMDFEINYVWRRQWSKSKILYILTRYFGLLLLVFEVVSDSRKWSEQFCQWYYIIIGIATTFLLYLIEIGMQLRIYALYNCSRRILITNAVLFALEVVAISTLVGLDIRLSSDSSTIPFFDDLPLTGCWNGNHPRFSHGTWFIVLAFEIYLFALVSFKAYKKYAHYGTFMGIFKLMFRDAIAWFFFITALIGWNAFSWIGGVTGYVFLGLPFLHAGACIGGSRLLLNLSKACYGGGDSFFSLPDSTTTVKFRPTATSTGSISSIGDTNTLQRLPRRPSVPPPHPPPPSQQIITEALRRSASTGRMPFASSSTYEPAPARTRTPPIIYTSTSSLPLSGNNALQLDFGLDQEMASHVPIEDCREKEKGAQGYVECTYAHAWAEVQFQAWGIETWDVERGSGRPTGRTNAASRDPRLASRSTSRSSATRRTGA
ncbi:hypothetical protein FRB94_010838 [Tulasnella sp. JGI-2019a]|nr:hypothetical protein FRB94_010838 [Tulasnella sp. JGI-2019a]